jgi:hypothetical protein
MMGSGVRIPRAAPKIPTIPLILLFALFEVLFLSLTLSHTFFKVGSAELENAP